MSTTERVRDAVSDLCEQIFALAAPLRAQAEAELAVEGPTREALGFETSCRRLLTESGLPLAGAGLVAAPGVLADVDYWLEWWQPVPGGPLGRCRRLPVQINPAASDFRDYTQLAWYARPLATGRRAITGPYVDYLCTDQYTLTFTEPVIVDGQFCGVTGVDILARVVERHLADAIGETDEALLVVNEQGRVVTSSGIDWVTGDLVRGVDLTDAATSRARSGRAQRWQVERCPDLPFAVLARA
ncbi:MAG: cache domain-containing protein [Micrococcales bacterium]|nr:cache domain-containing protein [Micrococcales bacterium]